MITSFRHKGLRELWETGKSRHIDKRHAERCLEILRNINSATHPRQLDLPGYRFHDLAPARPSDFTIRAYSAWRITFRFDKGNAYDVDLEQYHDRL